MKTELRQEILSAFDERIDMIVDGQPGGVFFAEEAIQLAKAEETVERILNIPHSEQCLVKEYLHGFMHLFRHSLELPTDFFLLNMLISDASAFFFKLNRKIDETVEVLQAVPDNKGEDVEPGEQVKLIIERVYREMEADIEAAEEKVGDKPDDDPLDFDSGIPF